MGRSRKKPAHRSGGKRKRKRETSSSSSSSHSSAKSSSGETVQRKLRRLKRLEKYVSNAQHFNTISSDENVIPPFDPKSDELPIERWVARGDQLARSYSWSSAHIVKLVANRLKGIARRWYDTQDYLCPKWEEIKQLLINQFKRPLPFGILLWEAATYEARPGQNLSPFGIYGGVQNPSASGFNSLQDSTAVPPLWAQQSNSKSSSEPYIDSMTATNVTALVGKSAYLSCRVRNLGNKTVSWIRHRDIHILTVGSYTYTSDQRFQSTHHIKTSDWTLQIKWAQKRDAGIYECQISTQPVTSYFVHLIVVDKPDRVKEESTTGSPRSKDDDDVYQKMFADTVPSALVLGGPDLHYDKGSTINLTCEIRFSPEPPAYIFWYHEEDVISYDSSRGGVTVITEKGEETTSFLLIQHADISDSGKYSCSPSNADVASVRVHVLNGERPAAMQTGSAGLSNSCINMIFLLIVSYLYSSINRSFQLNSPCMAFSQR